MANFKWRIHQHDINKIYKSESFNIKHTTNLKWIFEFFESDQERKYVKFRLYNEDKDEFYFSSPVQIDIVFGCEKICSMITNSIKEFSDIIWKEKLLNLRHDDTLYVNIRIEKFKSEQKLKDMITISKIEHNFHPFLISDVLSDVSFQIENKEFPAHKIILAAASPVFEKMFTHQMKENITNNVQIEDTDPDVFKEMLNYIYMGKVENLNSMAFDLYELANKYEITKLQIICEESLENCLDVDNVTFILEFADRHNSVNLKNECIKYINEKFDEVRNTESYKNLKRELLIDIISFIKDEI
ncbi:speckle-type POZ protein-like [Leptopilina boulardi]|uniref:speckle-type POZ protein-like n=1 Tax=Leptopilina boulardi TaxID=63433 RepID=UPI0021F69151|nr:speckle-type POZ protein-like [Leptopilina boulardi]